MMRTLALLLPAIIPSWRFFDGIAPSPRIEFRQTTQPDHAKGPWQTYRPRPPRLPIAQMLKRLIWNPDWNEQLFLLSCAERLRDAPTPHSLDQIRTRLHRDLPQTRYLQFRVVFVRTEAGQLTKDVLYTSAIEPRCDEL